jgi:urease accessory protein
VIKCDLLVINKADLAPHVGVDLNLMVAEARAVRQGKPVLMTDCRRAEGIDAIVTHLEREVLFRS